MSLITSLSYSITSTFKRVTIILASVAYFGKTLTWSNLSGIIIASIGKFDSWSIGYVVTCRSYYV